MYYVMECPSPNNGYNASFRYRRDDPLRSWTLGSRFDDEPPTPIPVTIELKSDSVLPELNRSGIPLITKRLHQALIDGGVDNLDIYPTCITDPKSGNQFDDYFAFNLIGLIAAADLGKSRYTAPDGGLISVDFDSIAIDEKKTKEALMFRLAESTNVILVHESIKEHLENAGFTSLRFYDPENYAS